MLGDLAAIDVELGEERALIGQDLHGREGTSWPPIRQCRRRHLDHPASRSSHQVLGGSIVVVSATDIKLQRGRHVLVSHDPLDRVGGTSS
jgi:hypothetical protein